MSENTTLIIGFHGRIIEHIGIQMYQSPTAALAEIVSNAWDADATEVNIKFDFESEIKTDWTITVSDNGNGMTKDECQSNYLNVGYNRREEAGDLRATSPQKSRPLMGRKGIGKFAGFGIARYISIDTVSETGERTEFELDQNRIREGDSYVSTERLEIDARVSQESSEGRHGTKIVLRDLNLSRRISEGQFRASCAALPHQQQCRCVRGDGQ